MMEVIRTDVMRGAFGEERAEPEADTPTLMLSYDPEAPYKTLAEASGNHGVVEEILGFFVAPFSGHYSFMTWGRNFQDVWLSKSTDPGDMIQVAEKIDDVKIRVGSRRRLIHSGSSIFYNYAGHTNDMDAHIGTKVSDSYGSNGQGLDMRTPTEVTLPLEQGERRFFVKRHVQPEDWRPGFNNRRRRRAYSATGLRIHKPDLSNLTATQRELLSDRKSWPEIVKITKFYSKSGGQWRLGLREKPTDAVTYTAWIQWNFGDWHVAEALNEVVMPSGTKVFVEGWHMKSYSSGEEKVDEYMFWFWRPMGNLPDLEVEYDQMRSRVEVSTITDGDPDDLFIWPLPASLFEVPVTEPSVTLVARGIRAHFSDPSPLSESNETDDSEDMEAHVFPCELGKFNATSCSSAFGCQWGDVIQGIAWDGILDAAQLYDSWEECQQRCCHDKDCLAASYDEVTKLCNKHSEFQESGVTITLSDTGRYKYAPLLSRGASSDGYGAYRAMLEFPGVRLASYPGHRSVTFCKAQCSADPLCLSIIYEEGRGCFLQTQCVNDNTIKVVDDNPQAWIYYKENGQCRRLVELDLETRNFDTFILRPYDQDLLTNGYQRDIDLSGFARSGFVPVAEDSDRELQIRFEEEPPFTARRLSSVASTSCGQSCAQSCRQESLTKEQLSLCQSDCFGNCDNTTEDSSDAMDMNLSNSEDSDVSSTSLASSTETSSMVESTSSSSSSEAMTSTTVVTMTMTATSSTSSTTSATNTTVTTTTMSTTFTTSTSTTTLPPPPVRLVQRSGDIFNVGDPLPEDGFVAGRVEVLYDGHWGTATGRNENSCGPHLVQVEWKMANKVPIGCM
eukprot:symbB.v1.2.010446.t1/scaffold634.1/size178258/3